MKKNRALLIGLSLSFLLTGCNGGIDAAMSEKKLHEMYDIAEFDYEAKEAEKNKPYTYTDAPSGKFDVKESDIEDTTPEARESDDLSYAEYQKRFKTIDDLRATIPTAYEVSSNIQVNIDGNNYTNTFTSYVAPDGMRFIADVHTKHDYIQYDLYANYYDKAHLQLIENEKYYFAHISMEHDLMRQMGAVKFFPELKDTDEILTDDVRLEDYNDEKYYIVKVKSDNGHNFDYFVEANSFICRYIVEFVPPFDNPETVSGNQIDNSQNLVFKIRPINEVVSADWMGDTSYMIFIDNMTPENTLRSFNKIIKSVFLGDDYHDHPEYANVDTDEIVSDNSVSDDSIDSVHNGENDLPDDSDRFADTDAVVEILLQLEGLE